ncbi:hypothetical protein F2Q69_00009529 [Brassica cretica]|uniref:Uncharacterized protein n=1 Tax=Brassica cretica TaxID=69181 RepID=A0A8S9P6B0_BRACR|nr:hypothetical protein F2Q69_00009529 [Brassica cretica]
MTSNGIKSICRGLEKSRRGPSTPCSFSTIDLPLPLPVYLFDWSLLRNCSRSGSSSFRVVGFSSGAWWSPVPLLSSCSRTVSKFRSWVSGTCSSSVPRSLVLRDEIGKVSDVLLLVWVVGSDVHCPCSLGGSLLLCPPLLSEVCVDAINTDGFQEKLILLRRLRR